MKLEKLRELRKLKDLSIQELSGLTGINRYRLSLIERGKVNPSFGSVIKIVEVLGYELGVFERK